MTEPTVAMAEAGLMAYLGDHGLTGHQKSALSGPMRRAYLAMKALDPDTHCASSDEVERIARAQRRLDAFEGLGPETEIIVLLRDFRILTALAAMSVQSDKGEG